MAAAKAVSHRSDHSAQESGKKAFNLDSETSPGSIATGAKNAPTSNIGDMRRTPKKRFTHRDALVCGPQGKHPKARSMHVPARSPIKPSGRTKPNRGRPSHAALADQAPANRAVSDRHIAGAKSRFAQISHRSMPGSKLATGLDSTKCDECPATGQRDRAPTRSF